MARFSQRRAIAVVTLAFIALSAVLHATFGSLATLMHFPSSQPVIDQEAVLLSIVHFETRTPRPMPTATPPPILQPPPWPPAPSAHLHPTIFTRRAIKRGPSVMPALAKPGLLVAPPQPTAIPATPTPGPIDTPNPVETPIDARDQIIDAAVKHLVKPRYPEMASFRGEEGTVIILLTIGPDGNVLDTRIAQSSGSLSLDQEAVYAAKHSSYFPPEIDGKPAIMTYRVVYTFQMS